MLMEQSQLNLKDNQIYYKITLKHSFICDWYARSKINLCALFKLRFI